MQWIHIDCHVNCCNVRKGATSTGSLWGCGLIGGTSHCTTPEGRLQLSALQSGQHAWEYIGRAVVLRACEADCWACPRAATAAIGRSFDMRVNQEMLCELFLRAPAVFELCKSRQRLAFVFGADRSRDSLADDIVESICMKVPRSSYSIAVAANGVGTHNAHSNQGHLAETPAGWIWVDSTVR